MHVVKLNITGPKTRTDQFFEFADYYFGSLYGSNQIVNKEWQYAPIENGVSLNLICPETDSYKSENSTSYAKNWKKKLEEELECKFEFTYLGLDPFLGETLIPTNSKFFILKAVGYSPLKDGESFEQIPLYKIPFTYLDGECYNDINFWEKNHDRIEGLWFNGVVGERWAQDQLQNHDSELSKQGIKCCEKIEEITKIPAYYFLFNYRSGGQEKDKERKCPSCGKDWLITENSFNDFYAFKCIDCRLVSEVTLNSDN